MSGGGASTAVTFAVKVDSPLPGGVTQVANSAVVDFTCVTGTCTSPPGTDTTPVTSAVDLTISKDDGGRYFPWAEDLPYDFARLP